ncbi:MAG TPA: class I SAM-dependent methyltransferase [bacterium]|nr:class I SAM-dependent methyltransferase [bacterium]
MSENGTAELYDFFHKMPRQGPGSPRNTVACLNLIRAYLPKSPRVLEVGAGTGASTLDLARQLNGHIIALDNDEKALDILEKKAASEHLNSRITTCVGCMSDLRFPRHSFDLIWSETSAYFMGFREALHYWRHFLKYSGILAVSELTRLRPDPPQEAMEFWTAEYPAITDVDTNLDTVHAAGYEILNHSILDREEWESHYYSPMEELIGTRLAEEPGNERLRGLCAQLTREIEMFRSHHDYYGFLFVIARKSMAA